MCTSISLSGMSLKTVTCKNNQLVGKKESTPTDTLYITSGILSGILCDIYGILSVIYFDLLPGTLYGIVSACLYTYLAFYFFHIFSLPAILSHSDVFSDTQSDIPILQYSHMIPGYLMVSFPAYLSYALTREPGHSDHLMSCNVM